MMGRITTAGSLSIFTTLAAYGQVATSPLVFEVASIRVNKTAARGGSMDFSRGGDRFTMTNMPLGALVLIAYNISVRQLFGADALLSEKYDIAAKAEHPVSPDAMLRMLQALLVDRFKLVVRRDTKKVPVYALTIGKGGPRLQPGDPPDGGSVVLRTPEHAGGTEPRSGHLIFKNESMPDFAWALSRMAAIGDRVVVDNTGLKGTYDFELSFERDGPSVFAALREQLGLKLSQRQRPSSFS